MEDGGALPYVISARMEAAIRRVTGSDRKYLLPLLPGAVVPAEKESLRRSRLYVPGNNPKLIINAGLYGSDGIILDLEDSVHPDKKEEARILVRNALRNNDLMGAEKMVRINRLPEGARDLEEIGGQPLNMILIPKCETAEEVIEVDRLVSQFAEKGDDPIWLMPIIESPAGIIRAYEIASATSRVAALAIGLEDYTASIGARRSAAGTESFYARSVIVNAARAAGIQPVDSVFSDFSDNRELMRIASESRGMGFEGMGCIHPGQIAVINRSFSPTAEEVENARIIVKAYVKAAGEGVGVVAVGSKMIDPPVVKRALDIVQRAQKTGLIEGEEILA